MECPAWHTGAAGEIGLVREPDMDSYMKDDRGERHIFQQGIGAQMTRRRSMSTLGLAILYLVCGGALAEIGTTHRLKLSKAGELYLDREAVNLTDLTTRLLALKKQGDHIVYYRESPGEEPSKDMQEILEVIMATKIPIQMGDETQSEWGALQFFEVEVAPQQLRFAITPDQPLFFGYTREGAAKPDTFYRKLPDQERWVKAVDLLVSADRVIETDAHEPQRAFTSEALKIPSVHIRVVYDQRKGWQSWYPMPMQQVPSNIRSLLQDCMELGLEITSHADQPKPADAASPHS